MPSDPINAGGERTPVITAFLWDGWRILLALRSEQVSTFPLHWAGISGYLEGDDPAAWALVGVLRRNWFGRSWKELPPAHA